MKRFLSKPNNLLIVLLLLWTVFNIVQGALTELTNDEAYYWVLSGDLGFGYYDHPPMFGWLMSCGTILVGDSELGVRLVSILLQPLYLYLFWTLVRGGKPTVRLVWVYFLTAFSLPLLQLYGFVATPDAPLLMCTALVLWSYKRFLDCSDDTLASRESISSAVLLGVSAAAICYAKYHGVLVVALILLSNFRLLGSKRFYAALIVGAVFFAPHILWQWQHDWVSLEYHLGDRTSAFEWENVWLYILNFIVTFNPFILPIFVVLIWTTWRRDRAAMNKNDIDRLALALKYVTWGFLLFFLWSTRNVHVQPQWLLPIVFPLLWFVTRGAASRPMLTRYILRVGIICGILFVAARIFVMAYNGQAINAEIYTKDKYVQFADSLGGRPFISNGNYVSSSKMRFYGNNPAYARPDVESRSSHYQFLDFDEHLYMKPVAVEISDSVHREYSRDALDSTFQHVKIWSYDIYYDTISNYIPSRRVIVECKLPEKVLSRSELPLDITIRNPYPFDIPLGSGRDKFELILHLKHDRFKFIDMPIKLKSTFIPERGDINEHIRIHIPNLQTWAYTVGFTLRRYPYGSWYNSPQKTLQIINPR